MRNIATTMPTSVSGMSGVCPGYLGLPGQRKDRTHAGLRVSVRGVRGNSNIYTYTRARVSHRLNKNCFYSLITSFYPGQAGQEKKVSEIIKKSLSGQGVLPRTHPGHPGQIGG